MSEFVIRHYDPENDLAPLSRMLTEIEAIDRDGENTSEEYLRSMQDWSNFDPDQNVWIAELNGSFVGYGQILPRTDHQAGMYVVTHPTQRGKGLGNELLTRVLTRAPQTDAKKLLAYVNGRNVASAAFLEQRGFTMSGTSGVMVAPVSDLPPADFPRGFSVQRYPEINDVDIVVQGLDQCYKNMVGHHQNVTNADRFINHYGEEGIHLLFNEHKELIGICAAKSAGNTHEHGDIPDLLDAPGIIQEYRGQGLQGPLTLAVMNWLRSQGARPITLEYWGDDETTLEIYRSLGFEMINQQITYHREIA